jgi:hypothetical protein
LQGAAPAVGLCNWSATSRRANIFSQSHRQQQ